MEMKPTLIFSLDIETSGPIYTKHGILAIGWCAGLSDGVIVGSGQINMSLPEGTDFEKKCWEEFWSKNIPTLQKLKEGAVTAVEGTANFISVLDKYEQDYDVMIITDNPSFDVGFIKG